MKVVFHDPFFSDDLESRPLDVLLGESDVVTLHLPLTPETHRLMDARRFALMKNGSLFLNFARGKTMDEAALVGALTSGHLGGAGLDVFENEPAVHPALLSMSNVVMTPHIGGGTRESRHHSRRLACENVAAVLRGQTPSNAVNNPEVRRQ
jgi:phosphoglycerate dehydrogenase-like enzyme